LNEFQRLILFSQFFTIFGGIMYHMVSCVDKMLDIEETAYKRQERDIVAALIVIINLVAIGVYPIYRIVAVTSGFKGSVLIYSLKDQVSNLWTRAKGGQENKVEFQGHFADDSSTSQLLAEVRQLKATNGRLPMGVPGPTSSRIGPPSMSQATPQLGWGGSGASAMSPSSVMRPRSSDAAPVQSHNSNAQVVFGAAFGLDPRTRNKSGMYDEEMGKARAGDAGM
jgi:hypothetical protein